MKIPRPEEEKIIKDIGNLSRLKKEIKGIKDIVLRNIKNLFEYGKEEKTYCKPIRVNSWSNNYIEYRSNSDKNKILSVEEYLYKIRPYLRDIIINDLKQYDTWKIQLIITINFISSKDDNDEERVMQSKSNNIEIMIHEEADEVKELLKSLFNEY